MDADLFVTELMDVLDRVEGQFGWVPIQAGECVTTGIPLKRFQVRID